MKTKTPVTTNSINRSSRHCGTVAGLLIPLVLASAWFAFAPQSQATCQEGCLTNSNTVLGDDALLNGTGAANTALGYQALFSNTNGIGNTAIGVQTLYNNTGGFASGYGNTATGWTALFHNTLGSDNTANGVQTLYNNTGGGNTAIGAYALNSNTTGSENIAVGVSAGLNLTTGSNNIDIGNDGLARESGNIRIGVGGVQRKTFIAGISGVTVPGGVGVIVGTNGQLGTVVSSARFKAEIKPMDKASEAILALKPVTFRYKQELDPDGIPQFGLVAEQVEKVNPDLVARDGEGKAYTVRYEAVNVMLLNEFLKEHRTVQELKKEIAALTATVKEQSAQIQRVSVRIEARKQFPKVVVNER